MAQYGVAVSRDDSEPSVLGSARSEASEYLGASGDLRAETHTLSSSGTPAITGAAVRRGAPSVALVALRTRCGIRVAASAARAQPPTPHSSARSFGAEARLAARA
jgi:hypothetical protein